MSLFGYKPKYAKALWVKRATERSGAAVPPVKTVWRVSPIPRQTRVRPRSKSMADKMRRYKQKKADFLKRFPTCQVCKNADHPGPWIHHIRGRSGALLLDDRYWLACCTEGHAWIHENMEAARAAGFLCALGDWNRQP